MSRKRVTVLIITACSVGVSQLLFYYAHFYLTGQVPEDIRNDLGYEPGYTQLAYLLMSLTGGLIFGYLMVYRKVKMTTFSDGIFRMAGLFFLSFVLSTTLVTAFVVLLASGRSALNSLPGILVGIFSNPGTMFSLLIWLLIVAATQFMLQVSDKYGQGVLWKFMTGKYFHPREEERIFMFLDLKSSTAIAEKTGHLLFFELLRDVFADVTQAIVDHRGEIYQYVGDEVVISWPLTKGVSDAHCIRCFLDIRACLEALAPDYQEKYGVVPVFKAGIHHGKVTVGELGIIKKDIVFSGDVLNTTARIQSLCNEHQSGLLISGDTLECLPDDAALSFSPLGEIELRGKERMVPIYTLEQARFTNHQDD